MGDFVGESKYGTPDVHVTGADLGRLPHHDVSDPDDRIMMSEENLDEYGRPVTAADPTEGTDPYTNWSEEGGMPGEDAGPGMGDIDFDKQSDGVVDPPEEEYM